jgi:hypothetical protein
MANGFQNHLRGSFLENVCNESQFFLGLRIAVCSLAYLSDLKFFMAMSKRTKKNYLSYSSN